ncbi:MAG: hypothetical protein Q4P08_01700, partial [Eubacteriales bacterium]|nr:hypothetical protein [Eubacteriales bacterium]
NETSFFKELAPAGKVRSLRPHPDKKGRIWFWCLTVLNCLFAFFSVSMLFKSGYGYFVLPWLPQQMTNIYAPWGMINGLFMLLTSFASYHLYAKRNGSTLEEWGVKLSFKKLLKSILMALILLLFVGIFTAIAQYLFKIDFRYYLWGLRTLPTNLITVFLTYLPMYLIFGISVSIAVNSAYFAKIWNEAPLINDLFFALVNGIPAYVITTVGYHLFIKTGQMPNVFGSPFTFTFMVNAIPIFPLAVFAIRRMGRRCSNPYIPGIVVAVILAWMQVSSSFTAYVTMFGG